MSATIGQFCPSYSVKSHDSIASGTVKPHLMGILLICLN